MTLQAVKSFRVVSTCQASSVGKVGLSLTKNKSLQNIQKLCQKISKNKYSEKTYLVTNFHMDQLTCISVPGQICSPWACYRIFRNR